MILLVDSEGPGVEGTDAQADLGLRCPHMFEDMFSHGAVHNSLRTKQIIICADFHRAFLNLVFVHGSQVYHPHSSNYQRTETRLVAGNPTFYHMRAAKMQATLRMRMARYSLFAYEI